MPDPNLQACIEELRAVIAKHDCAAAICLVSQTHEEWRFELTPSWSRLTHDPATGAVRLRIKSAEFPSKAEAEKALNGSVHIVAGLESGLGRLQGMMRQLLEMIARHVEFTHWGRKDG